MRIQTGLSDKFRKFGTLTALATGTEVRSAMAPIVLPNGAKAPVDELPTVKAPPIPSGEKSITPDPVFTFPVMLNFPDSPCATAVSGTLRLPSDARVRRIDVRPENVLRMIG